MARISLVVYTDKLAAEPYSRMAGGMVKDALDEANINLGAEPERVVMIQCPACGKLNEEDSKFCQECGKKM